MNFKSFIAIWICFACTIAPSLGQAQEDPGPMTSWPRIIENAKGHVIIYQPQPESFSGNQLSGRAAVAVNYEGQENPVLGAVWFDARVSTDRENRTVMVHDVSIPRARFPDTSEEEVASLIQFLKKEVPTWDLTLSLDHLLTTVEISSKEGAAGDNLQMTLPVFLFRKTPTALITIEGEPKLQPLEGSRMMRVVNTPFFIVLDPGTRSYYLQAGSAWFSAAEIRGPWAMSQAVPANVSAAAAASAGPKDAEAEPQAVDPRMTIVVATEPTVLISTDGAPNYTPVPDTGLLSIQNSERDVFLEIETQTHYALVSGRWYATRSLDNGPWAYTPSDKLPAGFARIPAESKRGHVLASVSGTEEAQDAVLDAQIPQTSEVRRDATSTVIYDGEPEFAAVEGSTVTYAVNADNPVLHVGANYYLCRDAVWYSAPSPLSGWSVCVNVPLPIYSLPPSCPVYHVRYVRVYGHSPTRVCRLLRSRRHGRIWNRLCLSRVVRRGLLSTARDLWLPGCLPAVLRVRLLDRCRGGLLGRERLGWLGQRWLVRSPPCGPAPTPSALRPSEPLPEHLPPPCRTQQGRSGTRGPRPPTQGQSG